MKLFLEMLLENHSKSVESQILCMAQKITCFLILTQDEGHDPFSDLPIDESPVSVPDHPIELDSDEETETEMAEDDSGSMDEYEIGDPVFPGR